MKRIPTTSVSKLMSLFSLLESRNINVKSFLHDAGLDAELASYPDRRVPLDVVCDLNLKAVAWTGDEYIGLHQGEVFTGFSNVLGYVLMNCRDVAEAIEKYAKYQQLLDEGRILLYGTDHETVVLKVAIDCPGLEHDRHLVDHIMMGMLTYTRYLTGVDLKCRAIQFVHTAPADISEYLRLFQCRPQFGTEMNALSFDRSYLHLPILQPNRELLMVLERYAQDVLARIRQDDSLSGKARRIIVDVLRGEAPTIGIIASQMHMSIRNLQMKLKEEGTTYRELLAVSRKELAEEYLQDPNVPIEEITYLLGFSEPSVFHRTFKRWTGITPGTFRRQSRNGSVHARDGMR